MLIVDSEQGSEPLWLRASAGDNMDRGVGEELLADLWRAPEDTGWNLQPVDRGLQDAAPVPLEMTETRGPRCTTGRRRGSGRGGSESSRSAPGTPVGTSAS